PCFTPAVIRGFPAFSGNGDGGGPGSAGSLAGPLRPEEVDPGREGASARQGEIVAALGQVARPGGDLAPGGSPQRPAQRGGLRQREAQAEAARAGGNQDR